MDGPSSGAFAVVGCGWAAPSRCAHWWWSGSCVWATGGVPQRTTPPRSGGGIATQLMTAVADQLHELCVQLCSGGAASAFAKTCVAPFDRTKILLQTSSLSHGKTGHSHFTGVLDTLARVPREQGFTAFWRGNLTNCTRVIPTYALRFTFFDRFQRMVTPRGHSPGQALPLSRQMAAGSLSGGVTMLVTYPLDLLRTRMAAEVTQAGQPRVYSGIVSAAGHTVRGQGIGGLYQGLGLSLMEIMPYLAISFGGYEYLKSELQPNQQQQLWGRLGCGWLAGLCASLVCYPADTIKRQLMCQGSAVANGGNSRALVAGPTGQVWACVARMYNSGGVRMFYRGCLVNALNSGPAAALTFAANDTLKAMLGKRADGVSK
jgi:solute carrier family 25 (adenine nucleotide translocator) protein 4/5/6/31